MANDFSEIMKNIKKSGNLTIMQQDFSNQTISDQYLQCLQFGSVKFIDCKLKNLDFTGSWFFNCRFENCLFKDVVFRKCHFWDCKFKNTQIFSSDLTRSEFE